MKHLLLLMRPTKTTRLWVEADNYKAAVDKAVFRYPGVFVNFTGARKGNLWEVHKRIIKESSMKMFSSHPKNVPLIETVNELIDDRGPVLLLVSGVKVYLLIDHHRYLSPESEAKRMRLGEVCKTEEGLYYFYEKIPVTVLRLLKDHEVVKTKLVKDKPKSMKVVKPLQKKAHKGLKIKTKKIIPKKKK
jgi:hypothetical protein